MFKPELPSRADVKCRIHLSLIGSGSKINVKESKEIIFMKIGGNKGGSITTRNYLI